MQQQTVTGIYINLMVETSEKGIKCKANTLLSLLHIWLNLFSIITVSINTQKLIFRPPSNEARQNMDISIGDY